MDRAPSAPDWLTSTRQHYSDARGLQARIDLYGRFLTAGPTWHDWLFERLRLDTRQRTVDLGCGTGALWIENGRPRPAAGHLTLVDQSPEMLRLCREALGPEGTDYVLADLDAWTPPPNAWTRAVAAHVHFHLRDPGSFARRVAAGLTSDGAAYFTTPGPEHLIELWRFLDDVLGAHAPLEDPRPTLLPERLEAIARGAFSSLERHEQRATLRVTDAEPIVAYARSSRAIHRGRLDTEDALATFRARARERVAAEMAARGGWTLTSHNVLFVAREPRR